MSFQGHYVGYGDLEKMLQATSNCGDIFSDCFIETSPAQMGMEYCSSIIQAARVDGEIVHYWRWKIATVLMVAPRQAFDDAVERRATAAIDSAWPIVQRRLGEKARVLEALVAMPKDLKFLDGQKPAFLDYDKETACYSIREGSHA